MNAPVQVALLLASAAGLLGLGAKILSRFRRTPEERERRRRLAVNLRGRLGDATVTDIDGDTIYYSYTVSGVSYTTSQDISQIRDLIHADLQRLIGGPVSIKYFPRIPANSIVVCEEWSGLRRTRDGARSPEASDNEA
jgi:hypothetical protein